ncbi:hypothetical protein BCR36DRAFT_398790 [Piromyces finnis]|uniref:HSA domain-containing protein n=1 Tax=Piromyces finnis TaxID=1754191 RepID=A0A1Y1V491_9FUNG|nr:hypothetical protein BCR36DRAFT_398790 [Piromyces finnis]|eukprot:ORX46705.1 hypothetical protein BCR36DRAFT_398790 [Piromyces finnis]
MTDVKKGMIEINTSFNTDSTLIDDSVGSDIETLRKKLELIKEKETEKILLKRKELLKEKFITEVLKKPELLLEIKSIELSDEYEKQFQDFLSINNKTSLTNDNNLNSKESTIENKEDTDSEIDKNNKSIVLNLNKFTKISESDLHDKDSSIEQNSQQIDIISSGSLLDIKNEISNTENNIENENVNNENVPALNQPTTIRIRPIKIVKKLPPQKTKIPTGRTKNRPVNIPFNVPIKKSDRVEDWVLWKNKVKQQPLARAIQGSHKILTTNDWDIVYEELKQYKKIERYEALKAAKQLSFRQIKKFKAPPRTKTHWDHLLEEMRWLYEDFKEEKKWKKALAYKLAHWVCEWHQSNDKQSLCIKVKRDKNNRVIVKEHLLERYYINSIEIEEQSKDNDKNQILDNQNINEKDKDESSSNNKITDNKVVNNTTPSIELDSSNLFYCINGVLPNNSVNTDFIYGPPKVIDENAYIDVTESDRIIPINKIISKKRKFVDDAGWNKYGYELFDEADYEQAKTLPHNQRYDSTSLISSLFYISNAKRQKEKKEKREKAVFDPTLNKPSQEVLNEVSSWAADEKEILNEAIQMFGHNWRLVNEYMKSKNFGNRYMYECFDKGHLIDENEINNLNAAEQRKNMKELKKLLKISEKKRQAKHFDMFDRMKEFSKKREEMKPIRKSAKKPSLQAHETHLQSQTKAGVDTKQLLNPLQLSTLKYRIDTEAKNQIEFQRQQLAFNQRLPLMRSMQQQHPFPASMHFPPSVRPRPSLNSAQAISLQQQTAIVQQQQAAAAAAAMHKAQQTQPQGLPLQQHRIRPPQVGAAGNIASMRMPMNSNGMFNPEIKNLLQANQAAVAANGSIGINMNNVKNQLGLNIMQAQRLSMNGVNGQIPYSNLPVAQLQALNGKGLNSTQLQAQLAHQPQLNNSNIQRQVQYQMLQNQRKLQAQGGNSTPLHSGQSAAALHAINNVHNAKFQTDQVRNRNQMLALIERQNQMRQQILQAQMNSNSASLQHNIVANQQSQQAIHHGSPQLSQGSPGITSPIQQTSNLSNQNSHRIMNVINNNSPIMSPQHSANSNIK